MADEINAQVAPAASLALQSAFAELEACGELWDWTGLGAPGPNLGAGNTPATFTVDPSIPQRAAAVVQQAVGALCAGSITEQQASTVSAQAVAQGVAQGAITVAIQASTAPADTNCSYYTRGWESAYASAVAAAVGDALVEFACCSEERVRSIAKRSVEDIEPKVAAAAGEGGWLCQLGAHAFMLSFGI